MLPRRGRAEPWRIGIVVGGPLRSATLLALLSGFGLRLPSAAESAEEFSGEGRSWGALCESRRQSPIDIEPLDVVESDLQVRLLYRSLRLEDVESVTTQDSDGPTRILFKSSVDLGFIQVGTDYMNFDEYALTALEVHTPSEHTFRHASWPIEIQLWHEPISLLRIPDLADKVERLANRSAKSESKVDSMIGIDEKLRKQMIGQETPWAAAPSFRSNRVQALDWIDATKRQIVEEASSFKAETSEELSATEHIIQEAKGLVHLQKRRFAAHQVVISLFILRTPYYAEPKLVGGFPDLASDKERPQGSELLRWISGVLSKGSGQGIGEPATLDMAGILGISSGDHRDLHAYHGSLTRPPCTPNVRWLVSAHPLPALATDLELFLELADVGISPIGTMLGGRDIQPMGPQRQLHRGLLKNEKFERPALVMPEMSSQGAQKWAFLRRYGKVFFMCASMLLVSPLFFFAARTCLETLAEGDDEARKSRVLDDEEMSALVTSPLLPPADSGLEPLPMQESLSWQVSLGRVGTIAADEQAHTIMDMR
mmetsp:Transcript_143694/g.459811  ORF Transcript_143694/g.459811 Transcript_143694/m.459811 type:complete len:541 (+) Transcript_143694:123-1745(+)